MGGQNRELRGLVEARRTRVGTCEDHGSGFCHVRTWICVRACVRVRERERENGMGHGKVVGCGSCRVGVSARRESVREGDATTAACWLRESVS